MRAGQAFCRFAKVRILRIEIRRVDAHRLLRCARFSAHQQLVHRLVVQIGLQPHPADFQRLPEPFPLFIAEAQRILLHQPLIERLPRAVSALSAKDAEDAVSAFVVHHTRQLGSGHLLFFQDLPEAWPEFLRRMQRLLYRRLHKRPPLAGKCRYLLL